MLPAFYDCFHIFYVCKNDYVKGCINTRIGPVPESYVLHKNVKVFHLVLSRNFTAIFLRPREKYVTSWNEFT